MPFVRRTRHTLRRAELGFLGVVVYTRVQTPRRWGEPFSAGVFVFSTLLSRPLRTSWAIVGIRSPCFSPSGPVPCGRRLSFLLTSIPRPRAFVPLEPARQSVLVPAGFVAILSGTDPGASVRSPGSANSGL